MSRRGFAVVLVGATALAGAGCGDGAPSGRDGGRPQVVAAFAPLFEAASAVGGSRVDVTDLTPAGAEPHDLELTSASVDRLEDADVVVYAGSGFQPAVEEVAERADGVALDVLPPDTDDPHIWLDPTKFAAIVEDVRDALIEVDPPGAATYRDNAEGYVDELAALDAELAAGLTGCARTTIVTAHAAFGHLAARYDLDEEAITGISPDAEPDPRRLAQLAEKVRAEGITTIFTEALVSPAVARTLAREAGVTTAVLDPIEGLGAGSTYASVMRENLHVLRTALSCP